MNKIKNFSIIIIGLLQLNSCCKDKSNPETKDNCHEAFYTYSKKLPENLYYGNIQPQCTALPTYITTGKYAYFFLNTNPNNKYEICYIKKENSTGLKYLCKYSFCQNKEFLLSDIAEYSTSWGNNNWILFTAANKQLYKIKSNGDNIKQLTNTSSYNNYAKWNFSSDKYVYYDASLSKMQISNFNGEKLDNFSFPMSIWNWYNDSTLIYVNDNNIELIVGYFNINSKQSSIITNISDSQPSSIFYNNYEILITAKNGMYKIKYNTLTKIKNSYQSYYGTDLQIISDNLFILNRGLQDTTGFDSCIVYDRYQINIIDRISNEERQILLPE